MLFNARCGDDGGAALMTEAVKKALGKGKSKCQSAYFNAFALRSMSEY